MAKQMFVRGDGDLDGRRWQNGGDDEVEKRGCIQRVLRRCMRACCSHLLKYAWLCAEFWTSLSITVLFLCRPDHFHPRVDSAVLTAFGLTPAVTNATVLRYDLTADLSFRNAHRHLTVRYLDVGATAFYNGSRLGPADGSLPAPFHQGPKNTTVLRPSFRGTVVVDSGLAAAVEMERAAGTVHLRVSVTLTLMYKVWPAEEVVFYKYDCWLWFSPPPSNATPAVFNAGTQCWAAK